MKIEFFHDVICSFCFPMSYRMRQVQKKYPNIEIIHRSFALAWDAEDLNKMFGNRDNA
ncbi:MAG: DsbA family protein, partial [Vagococcus sp.]